MKTATVALLLSVLPMLAYAGDKRAEKDYTFALEIYETQSIDKPHDVSIAKASDGNLYFLACADRSGKSRLRARVRILQGRSDAAATEELPDCAGAVLVPGVTYRARWQKGQIKVLVAADDSESKSRESTYTVTRSQKMTAEEERDCAACVLVKQH